MKGKFGALKILAVVVCICTLTACSGGQSPTPTVDASLIYTQAAQTVVAKLTQQTTTPLPATATPNPSPTVAQSKPNNEGTVPAPNGTVNPPQNGTVNPPQTTPLPNGTNIPLASFTPIASLKAPSGPATDKALWVGQAVPDGYQLKPGTSFDMKWVIQNVGQTTWKPNYFAQFFFGNKMSGPVNLNFGQSVKPGDKLELVMTLTTPSKTGEYQIWYKLYNDQNQRFGDIDLKLTVTNNPAAGGATSTPVAVPPTPSTKP